MGFKSDKLPENPLKAEHTFTVAEIRMRITGIVQSYILESYRN